MPQRAHDLPPADPVEELRSAASGEDDNGQPLASAVNDVATLSQADELLAQAQAFNPKGAGVKTQRQKIAARLRALEKE